MHHDRKQVPLASQFRVCNWDLSDNFLCGIGTKEVSHNL